jgi:hypothetical protein
MRCSALAEEDTMPENKNDPRQRGTQGDPKQKGDVNKGEREKQGNVVEQPIQDDKKKGMGQGPSTKEGKNIPDEGLDDDDRITQRNPIPRGNEEE